MTKFLLGAAAACAVAAAQPASALTITLNNTGGVVQGTDAYTGFRAAADFWQVIVSNDVTVNLNVGFSSSGFSSANVIGTTQSRSVGVYTDSVYGQLLANGSSQLDKIAVQNLSPLSAAANGRGAVSAITQQANAGGNGVKQNVKDANGNETVSNREWDNDKSANNFALAVNSANLKALGFTGLGTAADATIRFNSGFAFDFDPRNGIQAGQTDFIGTAIHEIGHALGFTSGVDVYDQNSAFPANLDGYAIMSALDLFRYSNNPYGLGGGGPKLDWSVGGQGLGTGRPFFSFDGGQSQGLSAYGGDTGAFSTGRSFGDGNQASHWRDTPYVAVPGVANCYAAVTNPRGIMDPTAAPCEMGKITSLDVAAFDAMGWNVRYDVLKNPNKVFTSAMALKGFAVPEPSTWALMIAGFGLVGGAVRNRRSAVAA